MSPSGLPAAGYPASARWHVFRFQVSGLPPSLPLARVQVSGLRFPPSAFVTSKPFRLFHEKQEKSAFGIKKS
jgi:hypothetical protein